MTDDDAMAKAAAALTEALDRHTSARARARRLTPDLVRESLSQQCDALSAQAATLRELSERLLTKRTQKGAAMSALRVCDHCDRPAVFRVALAASYADDLMEELFYCTERFQELAASQPHRLLGVINLAAGPRTMVGE